MPLSMISVLLVIPGLQAWARLLGNRSDDGQRNRDRRLSLTRRTTVTVLVLLALAAAASSIPARLDYGAKNFAQEYKNRGRFLQEDELEAWARVAPTMDKDRKVLASPFSGASHMYAIHGQQVAFPVAGTSMGPVENRLVDAAPRAANSEHHCRLLADSDVGYVYQESDLYQHANAFAPLAQSMEGLGSVVFETEHSRLIEVDCEGA